MVFSKQKKIALSCLMLSLLAATMVILKALSTTVDTTSGEAFKTAASLCYETTNSAECFNNLVIEKLPAYGFNAVSKAYMEFVNADGSSIREQCHRSAHYLGEYAGKTIPVVDDALKVGGNFCRFGYYHGVIEGYVQVSENLWGELPYLCLKITQDVESAVYWECVHSLGHAIVARSDYNIDKSLQKCLLLPVYKEQISCGRGVFMSWSNELDRRTNSGQSLSAEFAQVSKDSRWDTCTMVDSLMLEPCVKFFAQTTSLTIPGLLGYVKWCEKEFPLAPDVVVSCYSGIGSVSGGEAGFAKVGGWSGVVALCTSTDSETHVQECTSSAYSAASGFFAGKDMYTPACDAWNGDMRKEDQCASIKRIYEQVNKPVVISQ